MLRIRPVVRILPLLLLLLLLVLLVAGLPIGAWAGDAAAERADALYRKGFALQQQFHTHEALKAYQEALSLAPEHGLAHYEIGWSYWILEDWPHVIAHWERAQTLHAGPPELKEYLALARERLEAKPEPLVRALMGERASGQRPGGGWLTLALIARFQQYKPDDPTGNDRLDHEVFSPKSVAFSADGRKAYVEALEGRSTLVYDTGNLRRVEVIRHRFGPEQAGLFDPAESAAYAPRFAEAIREGLAPKDFNTYVGKPVEAAFSHGGRYLWVSHYRRDYDAGSALPSSVAIIDTRSDEIVRVMQTEPIPKFLTASPDGRWMAVVNWGDNTVDLIDVSAPEPAGFHHAAEIVVGRKLSLEPGRKVNRDRYCGLCLRGAVFTPDSRFLLVAQMGGGGIAVLDVATRRLLGAVAGMKPTPRHLLLAPDGHTLYVSSNSSGYVSTWDLPALLDAARSGKSRLRPLKEVATGRGTRTIALSPDGRTLYAAVNQGSLLVALDAATLARIVVIPADSYPVGLGVSPDGRQVWVTAQGRGLRGGNSVMVFSAGDAP